MKRRICSKKKEQNKTIERNITKIEVDGEFCACKVKKCRWNKHIETMKHIENEKSRNEMVKREEEKAQKNE